MFWKHTSLYFFTLLEIFLISEAKVSNNPSSLCPDDVTCNTFAREGQGDFRNLSLTPLPTNDYTGDNGRLYQFQPGQICKDDITYIEVYPKKQCSQTQAATPQVNEYGDLSSYRVCFDHDEDVTHFTYHLIYGETMKELATQGAKVVSSNIKHNWDNAEPMFGFQFEDKYLDMWNILKNQGFDQHFPKTTVLPFNRGHLVPRGDFNYWETWPASTFFHINAAPQLRDYNNGNWQTIEEQTRNLAKDKGLLLQVWTGTKDVLRLRKTDGSMTNVYLGEMKFPVPKYFWKVVYNEANKFAVAFIQLNYPFDPKTATKQGALGMMPAKCREIGTCGDIFRNTRYGLNAEDSKDFKKGFTVCCSFANFKQVLPYANNFGIPDGTQMRNINAV